MIKHNLFVHLKAAFEEMMSDVIDSYDTVQYVSDKYGIDADGTTRDGFDAQDDDNADEDADTAPKVASSYKCRGPLVTLMKLLATNQFDRTCCVMAKEDESKVHVDLTTQGAKPLHDAIRSIHELYVLDFPAPSAPAAQESVCHSSHGASEVTVQVRAGDAPLCDEATYNQAL